MVHDWSQRPDDYFLAMVRARLALDDLSVLDLAHIWKGICARSQANTIAYYIEEGIARQCRRSRLFLRQISKFVYVLVFISYALIEYNTLCHNKGNFRLWFMPGKRSSFELLKSLIVLHLDSID